MNMLSPERERVRRVVGRPGVAEESRGSREKAPPPPEGADSRELRLAHAHTGDAGAGAHWHRFIR